MFARIPYLPDFATLSHNMRVKLLVALVVTATCASAAPDILFLISDDLGWMDVGYRGSEIRTPNIDRLAAQGARLDRYYAFPLCSPTRAAVLTGKSSLTLGVEGPMHAEKGMPLDVLTLPEILGKAGYQTYMTGKWHLGQYNVKYWPQARGFDHFYGHAGGVLDFFTHNFLGRLDWQRNGSSVREEGYSTHLIADEAVGLLNKRDKSKPAFLYVAFNAPHTPLQAPEGAIDKYANIEDQKRRIFAAMVDEMDAAIGRVLEAAPKDALVVWVSDNGGNLSAGANNGKLRGTKGQVFEGGVRVPGAVYWPGHVEGGRTVSQRVSAHDWLPTLAAATGFDAPSDLYGQNMWPAIAEGKKVARKPFVLGAHGAYAIYDGEWKLAQDVSHDRKQTVTEHLFRINHDPYEKNDLAAAHPDKVKELAAQIAALPKGESLASPPPWMRSAPPGGAPPRRRGPMVGWPKETGPPIAESAARD